MHHVQCGIKTILTRIVSFPCAHFPCSQALESISQSLSSPPLSPRSAAEAKDKVCACRYICVYMCVCVCFGEGV